MSIAINTNKNIGKRLTAAFVSARIVILRWHLDCLLDERDLYEAAGMVGPLYMQNSIAMEHDLKEKIAALGSKL